MTALKIYFISLKPAIPLKSYDKLNIVPNGKFWIDFPYNGPNQQQKAQRLKGRTDFNRINHKKQLLKTYHGHN